ncbi:UDP-N-acetylglucosamine 2-epimerase (hydrolyzing), partial [bacterium]|nr:UDP-N-acetylglucosamine 2-epimerase (hydrolyzing) [bacterium]
PEFDDFALVIFHPLPEERAQVGVIFESILTTLKAKGIRAFVSYPNTDPGNKDIVRVIETFQQDPNFIFYKNLERDLFLSIFKQCRFILGNSSAGIIEAASIPVPAINVGKRQLDRFADANVVFVPTDMASILAAIDRVESPEFRAQIKGMKNSYGDGTSTVRAFELIRSLDPKRLLYKREDPLH